VRGKIHLSTSALLSSGATIFHCCTYFDHRYLARGLALYRSLCDHCEPFQLYVLCLDQECFEALHQLNLRFLVPVQLSDLESCHTYLLRAKETRSLVEYYFTLTPVLLLYLLAVHANIDRITYVDADMYFFRRADEMFEEMGEGSIAIVEHRFLERLSHHNVWGTYNVGVLSFANDVAGVRCLEWWRDRCIEWCYDRIEGTKFADQGYLNDWPARFEGVVVLKHLGVNAAPWNIENEALSWKHGAVYVGDDPLICYHFHSLRRVKTWLYDPNVAAYGSRLDSLAVRKVYGPYVAELLRADSLLKTIDWSVSGTRIYDADTSLQRVGQTDSVPGEHKLFRLHRAVSTTGRFARFARDLMGRRVFVVVHGRAL
jgi:hypothetical protein